MGTYSSVSNEELLSEYNDALNEYEEWVNKEIDFSIDWDDEIFNIVSTRDEVEDLILELKRRNSSYTQIDLDVVDKKWKSWAQKSRHPEYTFTFDRADQPKEKWWWWLDQN